MTKLKTTIQLYRSRKASGFTLIELVIVLTILGVIVAIAARSSANFLDLWIQIGDGVSERSEDYYKLDRVSRDVRRGIEDSCNETSVDCAPPENFGSGDIVTISINDKETKVYVR